MGELLAGVIGLAEGLAVGVGLAAFLLALRLLPRLAHLIGDDVRWSGAFESAVVLGSVTAAATLATSAHLALPAPVVVSVAALTGVFLGFVIAALAEAVDVLPVLTRRLALGRWLAWAVLAFVVGKGLGALLYVLVPGLGRRPPA